MRGQFHFAEGALAQIPAWINKGEPGLLNTNLSHSCRLFWCLALSRGVRSSLYIYGVIAILG